MLRNFNATISKTRIPIHLGIAPAFFLFAALAVAGCSGGSLFKDRATGDATPATPTAEPEPLPATAGAAPRTKPAAPARPQIARAPAEDVEAPRPVPGSLVGLNEADARDLLGAPHFVVREQPSTRWHYVSDNCTLDLFFFEDLETRQRRVLAFEMGEPESGSAREPDTAAMKACTESIRAGRNTDAG